MLYVVIMSLPPEKPPAQVSTPESVSMTATLPAPSILMRYAHFEVRVTHGPNGTTLETVVGSALDRDLVRLAEAVLAGDIRRLGAFPKGVTVGATRAFATCVDAFQRPPRTGKRGTGRSAAFEALAIEVGIITKPNATKARALAETLRQACRRLSKPTA
jgi:hypothetical protein